MSSSCCAFPGSKEEPVIPFETAPDCRGSDSLKLRERRLTQVALPPRPGALTNTGEFGHFGLGQIKDLAPDAPEGAHVGQDIPNGIDLPSGKYPLVLARIYADRYIRGMD